jgi:hypothetical protein
MGSSIPGPHAQRELQLPVRVIKGVGYVYDLLLGTPFTNPIRVDILTGSGQLRAAATGCCTMGTSGQREPPHHVHHGRNAPWTQR